MANTVSKSQAFSSLTPDERAALDRETHPILDAVAERIHYAESRRASFSVIAGVMIAGGLALLTLAVGTLESATIKYPISAAAIALTALGGLILFVYSRQTNRYPWTAATNTWKWFYRDALPNASRFDIGWRSYLVFGEDKQRIQREYEKQLSEFKNGLKRLVDSETNLDQDAEQLYVLHVNEKYKNLHLTHLRRVVDRGLVAVLLVVLAALVWGFRVDNARHEPRSMHYVGNGLIVDAQWRALPSVPDGSQGELLLSVNATNTTGVAHEAPKWKATDVNGWLVPTQQAFTSLTCGAIAPNTKVNYSVILRTGASAKADITALQVDAP
jgi:hypothetical protein